MDDLKNFDLEVDEEIPKCEYRLLVQGIGPEGEELDGVLLQWAGEDPEETIAAARSRIPTLQAMLDFRGSDWYGKPLAALHVWVETVVNVDGEEHFIGSIFNDILHKKN